MPVLAAIAIAVGPLTTMPFLYAVALVPSYVITTCCQVFKVIATGHAFIEALDNVKLVPDAYRKKAVWPATSAPTRHTVPWYAVGFIQQLIVQVSGLSIDVVVIFDVVPLKLAHLVPSLGKYATAVSVDACRVVKTSRLFASRG